MDFAQCNKVVSYSYDLVADMDFAQCNKVVSYSYDLVADMDFAQCNKVVSFYKVAGWTRKTYDVVALNWFYVCKFMHYCIYDLVAFLRYDLVALMRRYDLIKCCIILS